MNNNNNILVSPPRFVIARAIIGGTLVNYSKLGLEVLPCKRFAQPVDRAVAWSWYAVKTPIGR